MSTAKPAPSCRPYQCGQPDGPAGNVLQNAVRLQINKELPSTYRLPGKQAVTEQMLYAVLFNFLNALLTTGVGVCGGSVGRSPAARGIGTRN
jgi:hypothetical protein